MPPFLYHEFNGMDRPADTLSISSELLIKRVARYLPHLKQNRALVLIGHQTPFPCADDCRGARIHL